jgi:hypothetical protein
MAVNAIVGITLLVTRKINLHYYCNEERNNCQYQPSRYLEIREEVIN